MIIFCFAEQNSFYVPTTEDIEHYFDLSGVIRAVGVTDIYSRQYIPEKEVGSGNRYNYTSPGKNSVYSVRCVGHTNETVYTVCSSVYILALLHMC